MKVILTILWVAGVVLAQGFWTTFFAFLLPFYAWYIVIEQVIIKYNLL